MTWNARRVEVEILGYWHSGTGHGDGAALDAVVLKDDAGLPYLPGKHLKGLLRDACGRLEGLGALPPSPDEDAPSWTALLFGAPSPEGGTRLQSTAGRLRVDSATLGRAWIDCAQALQRSPSTHATLDPLFPQLSSTALEEGVAKDGSLRTQEVTVPMTLTATVEGDLGSEGWEVLATVAQAVKAVGKHRNRGLGRARVTLRDGEGA